MDVFGSELLFSFSLFLGHVGSELLAVVQVCACFFPNKYIYVCVCTCCVCIICLCVCVCVFFVCVLYVAAKLPHSTFYEVGQVEGWERMGVLVVCVRSRRERNESARKETRRAGCKGLGGSGGGGHVCV